MPHAWATARIGTDPSSVYSPTLPQLVADIVSTRSLALRQHPSRGGDLDEKAWFHIEATGFIWAKDDVVENVQCPLSFKVSLKNYLVEISEVIRRSDPRCRLFPWC